MVPKTKYISSFFFSVKKLHGTKRNKCELINALEGELGSYQS